MRCKSGKTWAAKLLRRFARSLARASAKYCYALPLRSSAIIVLPDFARS